MIRIFEGRGSTQVGNGIRNPHAFAECHDSDFAFEKVNIQFEEYVA